MKLNPFTRTFAGSTAATTPGTPAARPMGLGATALAAALLFGAAGAAAAPPQRSSEGPWAKGRVLVKPKPGLPAVAVQNIVRAHGGTATRIGNSHIYLVELPTNVSERGIAAVLANNPHFEFADLDHAASVNFTPNDPYYGSQWHLSKINTSNAWGTSQGSGVTIAILDTGVDGSHPDLKDRMVSGWNFYDNNSNTSDVHGHGTAVAGTAAGAMNNGTGVASVAGAARIMPVRISSPDGWAYTSTVVNAITWAADKGARVINISFNGMAGNSSVVSAADYAKNKGSLVVVSAGNDSTELNISWTTALIPVSATNSNDAKTSWSNWGTFVALSAPGDNIWTTKAGGSYWQCYGTSFSAPVTSGVIALMMAANPGLSSGAIQELLYSTAVDLGATGKDSYYGYGRVHASAAVQAAVSATTTSTDTEAPKASIGSPSSSATVSGLTSVDVSATDNVGVAKVELWVGRTLLATDTSAPYSFSWDTTNVANGNVSLTAKAFDAAGNAATSSAVTVNVSNSSTTTTTTADTTPPTAAISNPANGSKVGATTVKVTGKASDNAGVSGLKMALYINGSLVAGNSGKDTLDYGWNTRRIKSGTYTLTLEAQDAAGNKTSTSISVTR